MFFGTPSSSFTVASKFLTQHSDDIVLDRSGMHQNSCHDIVMTSPVTDEVHIKNLNIISPDEVKQPFFVDDTCSVLDTT